MNRYAIAVIALLAAVAAHADDYPSPTEERVRLSLGAMYLSSSTGLRLDASSGVEGTPVDAESEFGLPRSDFEPKFEVEVRAGERHRLRFDYFTLDRTGQATLGAPIIFRDVVFDTGDPVQTDLSLRTLGIAYEYSFVHRDKLELAASVGINDTDISARARVATQLRNVDQEKDAAGPIPTLGLDGTWVLSKRFYLEARAQYLKVAVDHFDGSLMFYEFDALYRLRPNIAFALGYTGVKATLDSQKSGDSGYFDLSSKGPEFFVRVAF